MAIKVSQDLRSPLHKQNKVFLLQYKPNKFPSIDFTKTMTTDQKKPCRVCSDFKTWTNAEKAKTHSTSSASTKTEAESGSSMSTKDQLPKKPIECPPDTLELGSSTWTFLHTMASYYPDTPEPTVKEAATQLLNSLSLLYPCSYCAKHLKKEFQERPPIVDSRTNLEQYLCDLHNEVNERLGKQKFDCSRIRERWREGPKDGSCDK
jgi:mitochondrial FAD-linked sulfhydryl oxidase